MRPRITRFQAQREPADALLCCSAAVMVGVQFWHGFGGGDYPGMLVVPGVVQWVSGIGLEQAFGGPWTAVMGLSFAVSMMGIQFAPGFTTIGMASREVRAFSIQLTTVRGLTTYSLARLAA